MLGLEYAFFLERLVQVQWAHSVGASRFAWNGLTMVHHGDWKIMNYLVIPRNTGTEKNISYLLWDKKKLILCIFYI